MKDETDTASACVALLKYADKLSEEGGFAACELLAEVLALHFCATHKDPALDGNAERFLQFIVNEFEEHRDQFVREVLFETDDGGTIH